MRLASLAFDGDPKTGWSTRFPQGAGFFFAVDLGRTERFSRLELHLALNPLDFPRSFAVDVSTDGLTRKVLFRLEDGKTIESTLMFYAPDGARRERRTVCVSTQVGCSIRCPFCATEMRDIEPVYREFRDRGLRVLAVNVRQDRDTAARFIARLDISYRVLLDEDGDLARQYGVTGLPTTYFIDREGRLITRILGETAPELFEKIVREML